MAKFISNSENSLNVKAFIILTRTLEQKRQASLGWKFQPFDAVTKECLCLTPIYTISRSCYQTDGPLDSV